MLFKTKISKKYLAIQLLVFVFIILTNFAFAQTRYSTKTKIKVVTHVTGQCTNPADSKAGVWLSAENGIDIDYNFLLSKNSELTFANTCFRQDFLT